MCGLPASLSRAARHTSARAASISVCMSASFCWIAPSRAIGPPNALRSFAYDVASSNAACAIPTAWAAIPMRPPSSVRSAIDMPLPGSPSRSAGVSSNTRSAVEDEFSPSFSSSRVTAKPSAPARTMNALMRSSSRANTRIVEA